MFDICHGCRRCVSLCQSFPDAVRPGRRHRRPAKCDGVKKEDYWKVVDQCYLCDLCYMTKCPYVPPHAWNLDFPHLMLRAKAVKFTQGRASARATSCSPAPTCVGQFAGIPIVVQAVNAVNKTELRAQAAGQPCSACTREALDARASQPQRFRWSRAMNGSGRRGRRTASARPGQGGDLRHLLRATTTSRGIGDDLRRRCSTTTSIPVRDRREGAVLRHAQARARRPRRRSSRPRTANIPVLAKLRRTRAGPSSRRCPVCALMFKQELPLMFPDDAGRAAGQGGDVRPVRVPRSLRHKDGLLKTDFKQALGKVSYHIPCHRPGAEHRPEDRARCSS
ncbi:MAG: hypothetical protein MZV65_34350 [Chromatiales bacterium]|nr:hypothetical protein [Chromatiales bacterium]